MAGSWKSFFMDAGIPSGPAAEYATVFNDNRMRMDMLKDLNKDILNDLGVVVMGDVLAVLRHSKKVFAQMEREKLDSYEKRDEKPIAPTVRKDSPPQRKAAVAPPSKAKVAADRDTSPARTVSKPSTKSSAGQKSTSTTVKKATTAPSDKPVPASAVLSKESVVLATTAKTSKPRKTLSQRFAEAAAASPKKPAAASTVVMRLPLPAETETPKPIATVNKVETVIVERQPMAAKKIALKGIEEKKVEIVEPVKSTRQISVFSRLGEDEPADDSPKPASNVSKPKAAVAASGRKDMDSKPVQPASVFRRLGDEIPPVDDVKTPPVFRRLGSKSETIIEPSPVASKIIKTSVVERGTSKPLSKNPVVLSAASRINSHLGIAKPVKHVRPVQSTIAVKREAKADPEKGVFKRLGGRL